MALDDKLDGKLEEGDKLHDSRVVMRPEPSPFEHYRMLFERSPIAQALATPDGRLLHVNAACVRLFGASEHALRGALIAELIVPEDRVLFGVLTRRVLARGGEAVANELHFLHACGQQLWLCVTSALLRHPDGSDWIMHTLEDVAQRHHDQDEMRRLRVELSDRSAALEVSNAEVESFSYSVSHDLRAPLRSIDGFSRLLLERQDVNFEASGAEHVQRIKAAAQRMQVLIDHLLELARVTRSELVRKPVDLGAMARSIADELAASARAGDGEREVRWTIADGMIAQADPVLLRTALANLLGNAWKYTAKQPLARIELGMFEREDGCVYFVRDDGVGFDMVYAERLFGAFQRLHSATEFSGNGIGLALVQRVVRRHGGRIWAEGTTDQGATFYFTLQPAPAASEPQARSGPRSVPASR